jgi:hypothetical protein
MTTVSTLSSGLNTSSSSLSSALGGSSASNGNKDLTNTLAGTGSSASSANTAIADSTSTALQQIADQIAAISAQAADNVQEFDKTTQDVLYDNNATARDIGRLKLNTSRLSVISALSPNDAADVFSFNVSSTGKAKLSTLVNDPSEADSTKSTANIRMQIFAKGKGLIADSDPNSGDAYQNYLALKNGALEVQSGQYSMRISRPDGFDPQNKKTLNYALQLTQGTTYTQDFTTTEQAYTPGTDDPFGMNNSSNSPSQILSDSLADAYSAVNSLPAIGTSGTSKLLGLIYTGKI